MLSNTKVKQKTMSRGTINEHMYLYTERYRLRVMHPCADYHGISKKDEQQNKRQEGHNYRLT